MSGSVNVTRPLKYTKSLNTEKEIAFNFHFLKIPQILN